MRKIVFAFMLVLALFVSGCAQEGGNSADTDRDWEEYMTSVEERSEAIKDFLVNEATTQTEMNMKSQELCELWEEVLDTLWDELNRRLPEEEFAKLQEEQHAWLAETETAVAQAGQEVEGGSMYPLVVNSEESRLTQERAYQLYARLKKRLIHA